MKKDKKIFHARSQKNGIFFYSNILPKLGTEVIFDDYGNITSKIISEDLHKMMKKDLGVCNDVTKFDTIKFFMEVVILNSIIIFFSIRTGNFFTMYAAYYFAAFVSFNLVFFMDFACKAKSKNGKFYNAAKFHAAEHMAINAYEDLQRIPTLSEVKKYSRFSKTCGSRFLISETILKMGISINMVFWGKIDVVLSIIIVIILCSLMKFASNNGLLRFMQIFITNKPTDKELELAIEGLKEFEKMEEEIRKLFDSTEK